MQDGRIFKVVLDNGEALQNVQRRGRPMPGTQGFHVNDASAQPPFLVTAAATESLLAMLAQLRQPQQTVRLERERKLLNRRLQADRLSGRVAVGPPGAALLRPP